MRVELGGAKEGDVGDGRPLDIALVVVGNNEPPRRKGSQPMPSHWLRIAYWRRGSRARRPTKRVRLRGEGL